MSGVTLPFGDGDYHFRLSWAGCAEVERKADDRIMAIYERVAVGAAGTAEIVEILRQGLLGGEGGVVDGQPVEPKPAIVNALLSRYVTGPESMPVRDSWQLAHVVIAGALVGYPEAQKKSAEAETPATTE